MPYTATRRRPTARLTKTRLAAALARAVNLLCVVVPEYLDAQGWTKESDAMEQSYVGLRMLLPDAMLAEMVQGRQLSGADLT